MEEQSLAQPTHEYIEDFSRFVEKHTSAPQDFQELAHVSVEMTLCYVKENFLLLEARRNYHQKLWDIQNQVDATTGKPITSTKAEIQAAATPESFSFEQAKTHVQNLERILNGLEKLQESIKYKYEEQKSA